MKFSRTTKLLVAGAGLVLLFCIGVVVYAVFRVAQPYISSADIESEIARIKARGEPVTLADLAPPKIPDAENAAVVYAKAFALLPKEAEDRETLGLRRLLRRAAESNDPRVWAQMRQITAQYGRVIQITRQAARRPRCVFPRVMSDGFPDFPHCRKLRPLVALVSADAMLRARRGDGSGAVDDVETCFRIAAALQDDYGLIPHTVGTSFIRTNSRTLRYVLRRHVPSASEIRRLDSVIRGVDVDRGYIRALQAERVAGLRLFERLRKEGVKALNELTSASDEAIPSVPGFPVNTALRVALKPDEAYFLKQMGAQIRSAHLSDREASARGLELDSREGMPKHAMLSSILLPVFGRYRMVRDLAEAELQGSRISLALVSHRRSLGRYPESLSELKMSQAVLKDPFSGKPFVYRRADRGFVLYSIGPNLTDDGGKQVEWPRQGFPVEGAGDIVWRFER